VENISYYQFDFSPLYSSESVKKSFQGQEFKKLTFKISLKSQNLQEDIVWQQFMETLFVKNLGASFIDGSKQPPTDLGRVIHLRFPDLETKEQKKILFSSKITIDQLKKQFIFHEKLLNHFSHEQQTFFRQSTIHFAKDIAFSIVNDDAYEWTSILNSNLCDYIKYNVMTEEDELFLIQLFTELVQKLIALHLYTQGIISFGARLLVSEESNYAQKSQLLLVFDKRTWTNRPSLYFSPMGIFIHNYKASSSNFLSKLDRPLDGVIKCVQSLMGENKILRREEAVSVVLLGLTETLVGHQLILNSLEHIEKMPRQEGNFRAKILSLEFFHKTMEEISLWSEYSPNQLRDRKDNLDIREKKNHFSRLDDKTAA